MKARLVVTALIYVVAFAVGGLLATGALKVGPFGGDTETAYASDGSNQSSTMLCWNCNSQTVVVTVRVTFQPSYCQWGCNSYNPCQWGCNSYNPCQWGCTYPTPYTYGYNQCQWGCGTSYNYNYNQCQWGCNTWNNNWNPCGCGAPRPTPYY